MKSAYLDTNAWLNLLLPDRMYSAKVIDRRRVLDLILGERLRLLVGLDVIEDLVTEEDITTTGEFFKTLAVMRPFASGQIRWSTALLIEKEARGIVDCWRLKTPIRFDDIEEELRRDPQRLSATIESMKRKESETTNVVYTELKMDICERFQPSQIDIALNSENFADTCEFVHQWIFDHFAEQGRSMAAITVDRAPTIYAFFAYQLVGARLVFNRTPGSTTWNGLSKSIDPDARIFSDAIHSGCDLLVTNDLDMIRIGERVIKIIGRGPRILRFDAFLEMTRVGNSDAF